ncbi:hypothetical protein LUZ61_000919 [Rhynchospora tenuis]|uniref:GST N-terminal domain-containing protein n=1 Tax=Rhynchospora tenuis TaxID=198213 RepID=A0AAD5ZGF3_9POAL|nr:hypothetical protein LUZ61_000919 [Rhynchospora tenuis]
MRTGRAVQSLMSRALSLPRGLPPSVAGASMATVAAERRSRWWFPPNPTTVKSVPVGIAAGVMSFSVTFATVAEAKERPPMDLLPKEVVLYQYQACPFCNKVRAFLDYHDIPYKVVEVNPLSKKEIKWSDYKKVPILVVDGEQLVDSSEIIKILNHKINTDETATSEEEAKWCRWVDDHLVHMLSPNIYRTTSEALESFDYFSKIGNFSFTEKFAVNIWVQLQCIWCQKSLRRSTTSLMNGLPCMMLPILGLKLLMEEVS